MSRILRKVVEGPWAEPSGCFHTGLPSRSQEGEGPPPGRVWHLGSESSSSGATSRSLGFCKQ